jgi:hypothetical protein
MSNARAGVSYLAIVTQSTDESESMAAYFNDHGVVAFCQQNEVNCPVDGLEAMAKIEALKVTWPWFNEHSDSGVLGMNLSLFEVPN